MRTTHLVTESVNSPSVDRSVQKISSFRATLKVLALVVLNLAVIYMAWTVVSDKADLNRPAHSTTLGSTS